MKKLTVKDMTRTAIYTALICIASFLLRISVEVMVPFSLLPIMIFLAGALLGAKLGALSVSLYVLLGLFGIPVFAQPPFGGFAYILQPTFGFILGYILAAYVVGKVIERTTSAYTLQYALAMLLGIAALYLLGIPYLYLLSNVYFSEPLTFWRAIEIGLIPFILLDLVKGLFAAAVALRIKKRDVFRF